VQDEAGFDPFDRIPKVELHCRVEGTVRPTRIESTWLDETDRRALAAEFEEALTT
jgi:hypothetical protein